MTVKPIALDTLAKGALGELFAALTPAVGNGMPARAPRKKRHPERAEQARIVGFLTSIGAKVWEIGTTRKKGDYQGTMQSPGLPDVIAFLKHPRPAGATYAFPSHPLEQLVVEVKVEGNTMRPEQRIFRQMCLDAGVAHVVGDLNDVIRWLVEHGYVLERNLPHYRIPGFKP